MYYMNVSVFWNCLEKIKEVCDCIKYVACLAADMNRQLTQISYKYLVLPSTLFQTFAELLVFLVEILPS